MAADGQQNSNFLTSVAQVFGLFAGAGVLVYIAGGIVLALRLGFDNLKFETIVSQLPKEFVISEGLSFVVLPCSLGAALYVVYRLIRREPRRPKLKRFTGLTGDWWKFVLAAVGVSLVLILPAVLNELLFRDGWRWGLMWFVLAFALAFLNTVAVLQIRALLVDRKYRLGPQDNPRAYVSPWNNEKIVAVMAGLYAAALLPGAIAFAATVPLPQAKICQTTGSPAAGSLIGETKEKIFLGLGEHTVSDRKIAVIPYSLVQEVLVGPEAKDAQCPPQLPKNP